MITTILWIFLTTFFSVVYYYTPPKSTVRFNPFLLIIYAALTLNVFGVMK